jgi:hypothetical protein
MHISEEELTAIRNQLARAIAKAMAGQYPGHWSVLTEIFPYLDRGIAADLMSLVRTTKRNRTNGDFCSSGMPMEYLPFVVKALSGERIDVIHDFPRESMEQIASIESERFVLFEVSENGEKVGKVALFSKWSENDVMIELQTLGYPTGGSVKFEGWPSSKGFELEIMGDTLHRFRFAAI